MAPIDPNTPPPTLTDLGAFLLSLLEHKQSLFQIVTGRLSQDLATDPGGYDAAVERPLVKLGFRNFSICQISLEIS